MILLSYPCFFDSFREKLGERLYLADMKFLNQQVKDSSLIIFTGGGDVSPELYNEDNISSYCDMERDILEYALMELALRYNKPVLGTCRGLQLINVYFGGTLFQDISPHHNHNNFNWQSDLLAELFPKTNSMHHQGIKDLATEFIELGNTQDGLTEAIFSPNMDILAFQFHPELIQSPFWNQIKDTKRFFDDLKNELVVIGEETI